MKEQGSETCLFAKHTRTTANTNTMPPRSRVSWFTLARGPLLWCLGVAALISLGDAWWRSTSSTEPPTVVLSPALAFLGLTTSSLLLSALTLNLFWHDIYASLIQPKLQPVAAAAAQWSLDDILTILCDPTQLAAYVSATILLPFTLYTLLPTTPDQRARVLGAMGVIPEATAGVILNQAGGWKKLLPVYVRQVLERMEDDTHSAIVDSRNDNDSDAVSMADSSESDDDDQTYFPYSVSPVYRTSRTPTTQSFETNAKQETVEPLQPHDILAKVIVDAIRTKLDETSSSWQDHRSTVGVTAVAAATILYSQMKHSRTARTCVMTAFHMCVTAGAGTAMAGSVAAFVARYYFLLRTKPQHRQQQSGQDWCATASAVAAAAATVYTSIPRSVAGGNRGNIQRRGGMLWKGTLAAFIFWYFQYRRRRRLRESERTIP